MSKVKGDNKLIMKEIDNLFLSLSIHQQRKVISMFQNMVQKYYSLPEQSILQCYERAERCKGCNNRKACVCKPTEYTKKQSKQCE